MIKHEKEVLGTLSKEQLIHIIDQCEHSLFLISETCVEESKLHISSKDAVEQIRDYIYTVPSRWNEKELKAYLDMEMGKITGEEFRKIILG
jgi:hypothetical protein